MIDDPNTPPSGDAPPSNPFADLQAELETLDLENLGQPAAAETVAPAVPAAPAAQPAAVQPQPLDPAGMTAVPPPAPAPVAPVQPPQAGPKLRFCPDCNEVREFVSNHCVHCGREFDPSAKRVDSVYPAFPVSEVYVSPRSPLVWVALGLLLLALLGIAGWFAYPMLVGEKKERSATDASTDVAGAAKAKEADAEAAIALKTLTIDDALKTRITSALRAGNEAWAKAGTKAYVYRYSIRESSEVGKSQSLRIMAFTGGADAVVAARDKDRPFFDAMQSLLDELNGNAGVSAALELNPGKDEDESPGDVYVVYGKDFGQDHIDELQPVIDSLENYKHDEGQYPLALDGTVVGNIRTKGNPNFTAGGYGYIPLFRTDSSGNVVMGTGAGVKHLQPAEVSGYYLLRFLSKPTEGMDFYSQADLNYYLQKISPFPYSPKGRVRNMPLTKDGKPDGVACVVKNGKLL